MIIYFLPHKNLRQKLKNEFKNRGLDIDFSDKDLAKCFSYSSDDPKFIQTYFSKPDINDDYIISITDDVEFTRFFNIVDGKELARFNSGKPEFSYIDFRIFEDVPRIVKFYNWFFIKSKQEILTIITSTCSAIAFDTEEQEYLRKLKSLVYYLSLLYLDIPFDKENDVLDLRAFESMAFALMHGAKKYNRNNWMKPCSNKLSSLDSLLRHVKYLKINEEIDKDSQLHHVGHMLCNVMFLIYHLQK
jgi:hypothetical protein